MEIEFVGGNVYQYRGPTVTKHYEAMVAAESKGQQFQHVRRDKELNVTKVDRVAQPGA